MSYYFVGYSERSRGFKFYDPSNSSFFETGNTKFIEDVEYSGSDQLRKIVFEEEYVNIPTIVTENDQVTILGIIQNAILVNQVNINIPELPPVQNEGSLHIHEEEQVQRPQLEVSVRRSTRERRNVISDDYIVVL